MDITHHVAVRPRTDPQRVVGVVGVATVVVLLLLAIGVGLGRQPLPLPVVLGFGVGLLGTLALAVARYDAVVAVGVLLLAAVRIEPAPADLLFGVLMAVAFATWRFDLQRVPLSVALLVSAFLALNLLASIEVIDAGRALNFFAITLYLAVFGLWLASYVNSVARTPGAGRIPRRRRDLGGPRLSGPGGAVSGKRRVRLGSARARTVQGPQRL